MTGWLGIVLGLVVGGVMVFGFNYWYGKTRSPLAWRLWSCSYIGLGVLGMVNSAADLAREGFQWLQLFWFVSGAAITWIGLYGWQGRKSMDQSRED